MFCVESIINRLYSLFLLWKRYAVTLLPRKGNWETSITLNEMFDKRPYEDTNPNCISDFSGFYAPPPKLTTYQTWLCGTDTTLVTETSVRWKICQLLMANSQQETLSLLLCSLALFPYPLYPFSSSDSFPSFHSITLFPLLHFLNAHAMSNFNFIFKM